MFFSFGDLRAEYLNSIQELDIGYQLVFCVVQREIFISNNRQEGTTSRSNVCPDAVEIQMQALESPRKEKSNTGNSNAVICQHSHVREIGQDFDKDGRLLRLVRCQDCGLLLREYLPML